VSATEFRLLGTVEARADGTRLDLGGPRPRAVLALLLLDANRIVSSDRLIDSVWGEDAPASAAATLQSYVSRLRKAIGSELLESAPNGYVLRVAPDRIDARRFEQLIERGRACRVDDPAEAARLLTEALALWHGEPLGDLAYERWASLESERLSELRATALEDAMDAELALGRHAELVGELQLMVVRHPTRERLREQLMLALSRSGRQAEALEDYHAARRTFADELGIDPGRPLQHLEQAILRQDPALEYVPSKPQLLPSSGLIGREDEVDRLREALESALAGDGRLVTVTGEAGIGKTRLAEQLAQLAGRSGAMVVWGRCWQVGGAPPYWPWTQILRSYLGRLDPADLRPRLGARLSTLADALPALREVFPDLGLARAPDDRFEVFSATAELFATESRQRPIALFVDDAHAADESSLLLLRFLADAVPEWPLLLVAVWRDEAAAEAVEALLGEIASRSHVRIHLSGLPEDEVGRLVERTTGLAPSDSLVTSIHADTGGNPLFVAEVARMLASEGRLDATSPRRVRLPAGVRDAIGTRLRRLSPACRSLLVFAAMIGREFDLPTLGQVAGVEASSVLDSLDEAIQARIVADDPDGLGRFRFAHGLVRDTIYEELTQARRMRLHRQVGEALEHLYAGSIETHLDELAFHFFEAGPVGEAARAVAYAERAGRRALDAFGFEEAARLYGLALRALELTGERNRVRIADDLLGLGEAQARAAELVEARATFLKVAEIAREDGLPAQLGLAALGLSGRFGWTRQGADPAIVPLLEEAIAALGPADSAQHARLLARLAGALRDRPAREPRDGLSAEAVAIARRLGDTDTLAYTLEVRFYATWWAENPNERLALVDELVELTAGSRDPERVFGAHYARANSLYELGRLTEAEVEMEHCRRAAVALGQPSQLCIVSSCHATSALSEGRFADAEALANHTLLVGGVADAEVVVAHRMQLFAIRREQARLGEIERDLAAAAATYGNRWLLQCLVANLEATLERTASARRALEALGGGDLSRLARDNEWLTALSFLPEVCERVGDVGRARQLYDLLVPFAGRLASDPGDLDAGSIDRSLGQLAAFLGLHDEAVAHFEAAIERDDALGYRPWAAWSRFELGRLLLGHDAARARELVEAARTTATALGMTELLRRGAAVPA
jgi:DNA-binding SARP family transcriptional activator